jgi:hypothetical protein
VVQNEIVDVMSRTPSSRATKSKAPRRALPWARLAVATVYVALLATVFVYEYRAYAMLGEARQHEAAGDMALAATTCERLVYEHAFSTAVPAARRMVVQLNWPLPGREAGLWGGLHPLRVDWLALWGLPGCALVFAMVSLTRLGRRDGWAFAALGLAMLATTATLLVWGWFGYSAGGWLSPLLRRATPVLESPAKVYGLTWALIVAAAAILLCPLRSRPSAHAAAGKSRATSPNDPRMALQMLKAQRREQHLSTLDYVRRREAILSRI